MRLTRFPVRIAQNLIAVTAFAVTQACSSVTTQTFRVVSSTNVESAEIALDADFSRYDRVTAAEAGIYFPENAEPSEADQQRTRQIFRTAFLAELEDFEVVATSGPTTLLVQATLIDLRNAASVNPAIVRRELRDIAVPGALIFSIELQDSQSGKTLARAIDSKTLATFSTSRSSTTDWASVEAAAERWAVLLRNFLEENLGG